MKAEFLNIPESIKGELINTFGESWYYNADARTSLAIKLATEANKRKSLKVKIKKLDNNAVIPRYAKPGDAGLDFTAIDIGKEGDCIVYRTGLAVEIPDGHVGLLFPRSSIFKYDLMLTNHVGVIDSGYRGEILFKFKMTDNEKKIPLFYSPGEKIGQMVIIPYPSIEFEETQELSDSERGAGGYGSSGK